MAEIKGLETKPKGSNKTSDNEAEEVHASKASADFATQDKPTPPEVNLPDAATQSYVWLADGTVLRVKNEDLPQGGHLTMGHWQRGDKVFQIVAIYPVEEKGLTDE